MEFVVCRGGSDAELVSFRGGRSGNCSVYANSGREMNNVWCGGSSHVRTAILETTVGIQEIRREVRQSLFLPRSRKFFLHL